MSASESGSPPWRRLFAGPNAEVWMHDKCEKEMGKDLDPKDRSKIVACMKKMYCAMERVEDIPPEKLNRNEGHCKIPGKDKRVQAFKSYQGRVYGIEGSVNGKRAFFAACAASKKDNKLDPAERDRTGRRVQDGLGNIPGVTF